MNQLVQSLLFIAYVENGTVMPVFEKSDFAELVRRSVGEMSCLIEDKGQQLSVDIPDRAICWFDGDMMERVIKNLLENAIKYSPVKGSIAISMSQDRNANIKFEIENTGVTIPNASLPHLFEPFYRVDASRSKENGGNGLGMYIIKTLLESHDASYGICNTDSGVKFQFCLTASKIHRKSI
jgi:two-component system sensor histidine kinase VanS